MHLLRVARTGSRLGLRRCGESILPLGIARSTAGRSRVRLAIDFAVAALRAAAVR